MLAAGTGPAEPPAVLQRLRQLRLQSICYRAKPGKEALSAPVTIISQNGPRRPSSHPPSVEAAEARFLPVSSTPQQKVFG